MFGLRGCWIAQCCCDPEADGDSTPLGQRPLGVPLVVCRLWASLRHGLLRDWVEGWLPESVLQFG